MVLGVICWGRGEKKLVNLWLELALTTTINTKCMRKKCSTLSLSMPIDYESELHFINTHLLRMALEFLILVKIQQKLLSKLNNFKSLLLIRVKRFWHAKIILFS